MEKLDWSGVMNKRKPKQAIKIELVVLLALVIAYVAILRRPDSLWQFVHHGAWVGGALSGFIVGEYAHVLKSYEPTVKLFILNGINAALILGAIARIGSQLSI